MVVAVASDRKEDLYLMHGVDVVIVQPLTNKTEAKTAAAVATMIMLILPPLMPPRSDDDNGIMYLQYEAIFSG